MAKRRRQLKACSRFVVGDEVTVALPLRTVKAHVPGKTLYKAQIESISKSTVTVKRANGRRAIVPCAYVATAFGRVR